MLGEVAPYNILNWTPYPNSPLDRCKLYCDRKLLPFQIPVSATETTFALYLINLDTGVETVPSMLNLTPTTTNGQKHVTYAYADLTNQLTTYGNYRLKFTSTEQTLYSTRLCVSRAFQAPSVSTSCIGNSGNFTMTLTATGCDYCIWYADYQSTGDFVPIGQTVGTITAAAVGVVPVSVSFPVRGEFVSGDTLITRTYTLAYTAADPCGTYTFTLSSTTASESERFLMLEFWNNTNFDEKIINYVQAGYRQRFFFEANYTFRSEVREEDFQELHDGTLEFNYANQAEQVNIDFYPLPGHLITALNQVRDHDNCNLIDIYNSATYAVKNLRVTANEAENWDCQGGRMTFEINRAHASNC